MEDYVCKGCKKRRPGCKGDCLEYTVERIVNQPEKERMEKQKRKAVLMTEDKYSRLNGFHPLSTTDKSPCRSRKK